MLEIMLAHALAICLGSEQETSLTNALVTMYSRIGDFSSARLAFEKLEAKDVVSWTAMILAYSNYGHGYQVLPLFARMLKSGIKPDEITFVGDVRMADCIGERLIELQASSSGAYVLLANLHAARVEWDEFAQARKKMKERNVKKVAGFSQIEVKGKNHVFFVGDRSRPKVKEIYGLLRETLLAPVREM